MHTYILNAIRILHLFTFIKSLLKEYELLLMNDFGDIQVIKKKRKHTTH